MSSDGEDNVSVNVEQDDPSQDESITDSKDTVTQLTPGAIAGIVVAIVVVVVIVVVGVVLGMMNPNAASSSASGSSGSIVASSGAVASSAPVSTSTTQFLGGTIVSGTPQTYPGTAPINGPFTQVIPADFGTNPNSTAFFVFNQNGDSLANPIFGTSFNYLAPSNLLLTSSSAAPTGTVQLAVLGYALTSSAMTAPVDPFVPYCSSFLANLVSASSTNFMIVIPIFLPGVPSDYFVFVQNGDITSNSILVTGAIVSGTNSIVISYINGNLGACRLNIIIVARNTTIPDQKKTRLLYASNTVISSIVPATLTANIPISTPITQSSTVNPIWFAMNQTLNTTTIIFAVKQTTPTNLRVLFTAATNPTSFCFFAINANDVAGDFTFD